MKKESFKIKNYIDNLIPGIFEAKIVDFPIESDGNKTAYTIHLTEDKKILITLDRETFEPADEKIANYLIDMNSGDTRVRNFAKKAIKQFIARTGPYENILESSYKEIIKKALTTLKGVQLEALSMTAEGLMMDNKNKSFTEEIIETVENYQA